MTIQTSSFKLRKLKSKQVKKNWYENSAQASFGSYITTQVRNRLQLKAVSNRIFSIQTSGNNWSENI